MRRLLSLCLILTAACAGAGELQVVDDFERGVGGWQEVDGRADRTQAPYCEMTAVGEAHQGVAAARLRFAAGTPWAHMQLGVRPVEWIDRRDLLAAAAVAAIGQFGLTSRAIILYTQGTVAAETGAVPGSRAGAATTEPPECLKALFTSI